jgi:hypothetical protein
MTPHRPSPVATLTDVMEVVERRRRSRQRTRAAAGSALAIAGISITGIAAVTLNQHQASLTPGTAVPSGVPSGEPSGAPSADPSVPPPVIDGGDPTVEAPPTEPDAFAISREGSAAAFAAAGYSDADAVELGFSFSQMLDLTGFATQSEAARFAAGAVLAQDLPLTDAYFAIPPAALSVEESYSQFESFGYTDADLDTLAQEWGTDRDATVVRATAELKSVFVLPFVDVSPGAQTYFFDAGYTYPDAEALVQEWGGSGVPGDMKVTIGDVLRSGVALRDSQYADAGAADGKSDADLADAYRAAGYTEADAQVIATRLGVSVDQAIVWAGRELLVTGVLPWVDIAG